MNWSYLRFNNVKISSQVKGLVTWKSYVGFYVFYYTALFLLQGLRSVLSKMLVVYCGILLFLYPVVIHQIHVFVEILLHLK